MKWKAPNNVASVIFDCKRFSSAAKFEMHWNIVRRRSLHDRCGIRRRDFVRRDPLHDCYWIYRWNSGESFCTALWVFD